MKSFKRTLVGSVMCGVLAFSMAIPGFAAISNGKAVVGSDNTFQESVRRNVETTEVVICEGAESVPQEVIDSIIKDNPGAGAITILEYGNCENSSETNSSSRINSGYVNAKETLSNVKTNVTIDDQFKFSVAKGESTTLTKEYTGSFKGKFSKTPFKVFNNVEVTVSATYKKATTYAGPAEGSQFNSREFRIKFFGETGNFVQTADKITIVNGTITGSTPVRVEGSYTKPLNFAKYSIDSYQSKP